MSNGKVKLLVLAAVGVILAAEAAVVRKLPDMSVVEGEMVATDSMKATAVRSSNTAVFSAALRESGEAIVSGTRLGEAVLSYVDERGVFASRSVMVVPAYWEVLKGMFSEDPEISVAIVGDKVVVRGATANVDTLRRVDDVKKLDTTRIVTQVSYSTAQIGELVRDFLRRSNVTNIGVNVVGREVCLSGRMYDVQSSEQLKKRVEGFVHDFPGITVNVDELRIYKQKILISIEFVAYNDNMSRNLGFTGPEAITAGLDWNFGYEHKKETGGDHKHERGVGQGSSGTGQGDSTTTQSGTQQGGFQDTWSKENHANWTHNWSGGANAKIEGVKATINLLKKNGAAKTLYSTTLSTQSGIEAEFQNGGTIHHNTLGGMGANGNMESIEYGYIIKTTPLIIDANTVNLDFSLDNKQLPPGFSSKSAYDDIQITRYQTKSKYLMRPGESIMLSGFKFNNESENKKGTPWLSNIPWIGPYLFGNTANEVNMDEMLLVVTVNWALEDDSEKASTRLNEMKDRKVEVEMP